MTRASASLYNYLREVEEAETLEKPQAQISAIDQWSFLKADSEVRCSHPDMLARLSQTRRLEDFISSSPEPVKVAMCY